MNTAVSSKIQRVVKVVVSEKTSKVVPHITDEMILSRGILENRKQNRHHHHNQTIKSVDYA
jgi:uncharacterized membrane protein SirB2